MRQNRRHVRPLRPVIRYGKTEGANVVDLFSWGSRPAWAKRLWINARVEALFTNAALKESAARRRCLVVATGWYEGKYLGSAFPNPVAGLTYLVITIVVQPAPLLAGGVVGHRCGRT